MQHIKFMIEGGEELSVFAQPGEKILDLARKANVAIDAPCSGNGSCGKCRVKLAFGQLNSPSTRHISDTEREDGWMLACESEVIDSDAVVFVPDIASAYRSRMKISDLLDDAETSLFNEVKDKIFSAGIEAGINLEKIEVRLEKPTLNDTLSDLDRVSAALCAKTGFKSILPTYYALLKLPDVLREGNFTVTCLIKKDGETMQLLDLWPSLETRPVCGLAIDIGTTTVSAVLVNLETHKILSKAASGNGQIRYGADVINRIIEAGRTNGREKLQKAVLDETIIPIINTMCTAARLKPEQIYKVCITSNTTMNHLLLALNPEFIRTEPYIPVFMELRGIKARDIRLPVYPDADVLIAPNIGSYVGGDITAGTLASMLWTDDEFSLFIDLGTNGELVLGNSDFLVSCACSAGPAFEGGDISCGMRATDGAIESVKIDKESHTPTLKIIGSDGQKPVGLCGSGIIDCISEMYYANIINPAGKIIADGERIKSSPEGIKSYVLAFQKDIEGNKDIEINEIDIDNFIRAKGAIYSAIMTMLRALDFDISVISHVYIAGGIGSGINIENGIKIGMLPDIERESFSYIGNSSLTGAYAMLISSQAEEKVTALARNMTYMEMSSHPNYMEEFVSACFIPHTNIENFPSLMHV